MNIPLTEADLNRHEAERLHRCPRDENQGRGQDCPEHPRLPRIERHYSLDMQPPEKQSATWQRPHWNQRPRVPVVRLRFVVALVVACWLWVAL